MLMREKKDQKIAMFAKIGNQMQCMDMVFFVALRLGCWATFDSSKKRSIMTMINERGVMRHHNISTKAHKKGRFHKEAKISLL